MKLYIQRITTLAAVSSFLWTTSCRTSDTENTLATGRRVTISAMLDGVEFGGQTGKPQASTGKISLAENNRQSHTTMLDASSFITVESITDNTSPKASAKLNTMAAIAPVIPDTDINKLALPIGTRVRIAAYLGTSTTTDRTKDYIVRANGVLEPENGALTLTHNQPYTLVVYSNGTPTLPVHSGSINYTYDNSHTDLQKDFMYRKYINYIPDGGLGTNNIVIRLQHKTTQIVTNFNFADNITNIINPRIGTNYLDGSINLNNNSISTEGYVANGSTTGTVPLTVTINTDRHSATAPPVKINGASGAAGATTTGSFIAQINTTDPINGSSSTRNVNAPFLIKPGYKTTLNIVQGRCGANINGVNKFFMCHNLGADYNVTPDPTDPTTDKAKLHGAKYMWGAREESISMINDQPNGTGMILSNYDISENEWGTANSSNNPCPSGYRIPTTDELQALITPSQNTSTYIGNWSDMTGDVTNFSAFRTFTSTNNTNYSMSLPAAGWRYRDQLWNDGRSTSRERGYTGYYWASNRNAINAFMRLSFGNKPSSESINTIVTATAYVNALSVRCIAN
ncbi:FISUMP domain-containing protein [Elizabethkingia anophelis]